MNFTSTDAGAQLLQNWVRQVDDLIVNAHLNSHPCMFNDWGSVQFLARRSGHCDPFTFIEIIMQKERPYRPATGVGLDRPPLL